MIKKILVNATHPEENRVAIVEDGILSELDIEISGKEQTKGNIYKATVVRVESGLQAAFIDYGAERLGFLQLSEIQPRLFPDPGEGESRQLRINDILQRGQEILVQIAKEYRGNKGATLTTCLSLPGRYMVLMPGEKTRGLSRKIPDGPERKNLKKAVSQFVLPEEEMGYIVRTAALGQTAMELKRDLDYLIRVYRNIMDHSVIMKSPALVYRESNLVIRSLRDYFTVDVDEVLVDDQKVFEEARDFFKHVMPEYARLVKLHQERRPIFSKHRIEDQIETITQNKILLPSGGSIVIDSTEALVAIDVNSGKMSSEKGVEETAFKTNLEAAEEVARQLRLRDLGGLVVVDFIDMRDRKHIGEIEKRLKDSLKRDKARVSVGKISRFGLLEMSRQRIKAALAQGSFLSCPNCQGTGRIMGAEAQAVGFLRKIHTTAARGHVERVEGEIPLDVAHYLLNKKREEILDMERLYQISIDIRGRKSFVASQFDLVVHKREREEKLRVSVEPIAGNTSEAISYSGAKDETNQPDRSRGRGRFRGRGKGGSDIRHGASKSAKPITPEMPVLSPPLVPEKEEKSEATSVEEPIGEGATAKVVSDTKPDSKPPLIENKKPATSRRPRYVGKRIVPKAGSQKEAEASSGENERPSTVSPDKPISEKGSPVTPSPVEKIELKTPGDEESGKTVVDPKKEPITTKTVKRTGKTVAKKKTSTVKKVTTRLKKIITEVSADGKNEGEPAPAGKEEQPVKRTKILKKRSTRKKTVTKKMGEEESKE